jgi:hypothetical protein
MAYLVVPQDASASTATVCISAIDELFDPAQMRLVSDLGDHLLLPHWEHWVSRDGAHRLDYQRVIITGLQPGTRLPVRLLVNDRPQAKARVTTLPAQLPTLADKPFTVLLGSCFCQREDAEGAVGRTYVQLPAAARPEVKILCGDQVYLDDPWQHYLLNTHDPSELEAEFFRNYRATWMQEPGFRQLLTDGTNYFTADDHEYWNNAPNFATVIRDTWLHNGRQQWFATAGQFYQMFQTPASITTFAVGPLSFFIADTRSHRDSHQRHFMLPMDLDAVGEWIHHLTGPGVLVVGQPVFRPKTRLLRGTFADWNLPDYEQYGELAGLLTQTTHSILILSGDVHYGRIAWCFLPSGSELIEVISSPMSLVDKIAEGTWEPAPSLFPPFAVRDSEGRAVVRAEVHTLDRATFSPIDSHFLTLEFVAVGTQVRVAVRVWPVRRQGNGPSGGFGRTVYQRSLH